MAIWIPPVLVSPLLEVLATPNPLSSHTYPSLRGGGLGSLPFSTSNSPLGGMEGGIFSLSIWFSNPQFSSSSLASYPLRVDALLSLSMGLSIPSGRVAG